MKDDGNGIKKLLFKMLREKRKPTQRTVKMELGHGKLMEKPEEIKKLWDEYFFLILNKGLQNIKGSTRTFKQRLQGGKRDQK